MFIPKFRRKVIYNKLRADIQKYIQDLCNMITPENNAQEIRVWHVASDASLSFRNAIYVFGARPVFYLNVNVQYKNGKGTKEKPYQITLGE